MAKKPDNIKDVDMRLLSEHQAYFGVPMPIKRLEDIKFGNVIQFVYERQDRYVFVLNAHYKLQLHGISLLNMDRITLMNEVINRMTNITEAAEAFYKRVMTRPIVVQADAYRTYDTRNMSAIKIIDYAKNEQERLAL